MGACDCKIITTVCNDDNTTLELVRVFKVKQRSSHSKSTHSLPERKFHTITLDY
jgi:hypothetical protein